LRHRASDRFIGTVRLILQDPINPDKPFPIENHMQIDPRLVDLNALPRQNAAEISRFVILSQFTQRRLEHPGDEKKSSSKKNKMLERRRFPHVGLALVVGIVQMCAAHKIDHWLSVMNPSLNRLLSYFGSDLNAVGPFGDYHGMRRPYYIKLIDVLAKMYQGHRDVWELMTENGKSCPYSMKYIQTKSSNCHGTYLNKKNKATNNLLKENILI
jgi:N-acyl amino acid synthase of PEP-CTERM/exosortase system